MTPRADFGAGPAARRGRRRVAAIAALASALAGCAQTGPAVVSDAAPAAVVPVPATGARVVRPPAEGVLTAEAMPVAPSRTVRLAAPATAPSPAGPSAAPASTAPPATEGTGGSGGGAAASDASFSPLAEPPRSGLPRSRPRDAAGPHASAGAAPPHRPARADLASRRGVTGAPAARNDAAAASPAEIAATASTAPASEASDLALTSFLRSVAETLTPSAPSGPRAQLAAGPRLANARPLPRPVAVPNPNEKDEVVPDRRPPPRPDVARPPRGTRPVEHGARLLAAGHPAEAERTFRRVLAAEGATLPALVGLGAAHRAQGRPRQAEAILARAVARWPDSAVARNNLGAVLHDLGRGEPALRELAAARRLAEAAGQEDLVRRIDRNLALAGADATDAADPAAPPATHRLVPAGPGRLRLEPLEPEAAAAPIRPPKPEGAA